MAVDEALGRRTHWSCLILFSHFIFIKIDLRWIYSGYWSALTVQLPSPFTRNMRADRVGASNCFRFLRRFFHLILAATGRLDILIFSYKKKRNERSVWMNRETSGKSSFLFRAPYPFARSMPTLPSLDSFSSDCLAPGKRAASRVQGKYGTADGCVIL